MVLQGLDPIRGDPQRALIGREASPLDPSLIPPEHCEPQGSPPNYTIPQSRRVRHFLHVPPHTTPPVPMNSPLQPNDRPPTRRLDRDTVARPTCLGLRPSAICAIESCHE